jgi:Protein of unknown function (DUF2628)
VTVRTKIYSVYVKKDSKNPLETAIFVRQGFNFWAFLLTPIWAIYNRLWLLFIILTAATVAFELGNAPEFNAVSLVMSVWFGFEANGFKASKLERKGYIIFDVVTGIDTVAAEARFYDKYLLMNKPAAKQSSFGFAS